MALRKYISLIGAILLLAGCTERIDIRTRDAKSYLMIYGNISTSKQKHAIYISRSTGYFATTLPPAVSGATVTISHKGGQYVLSEDPNEKGVYYTGGEVAAVEGEQYTLHVAVDLNGDGNITRYTATSTTPTAAVANGVGFREMTQFIKNVAILLYADLPKEGTNYFRTDIWKRSPGEDQQPHYLGYRLFDDLHLATTQLNGFPCYMIDQDDDKNRLEHGDEVILALGSITKEYYEFLDAAQNESNGQIPFFSGPPANLPTNIIKASADDPTPIAGFFSAYSVSTTSAVY